MIRLMRIPVLSSAIIPGRACCRPFALALNAYPESRTVGSEDAARYAEGFLLERLGWGVRELIPAGLGQLNPFSRLQHLFQLGEN